MSDKKLFVATFITIDSDGIVRSSFMKRAFTKEDAVELLRTFQTNQHPEASYVSGYQIRVSGKCKKNVDGEWVDSGLTYFAFYEVITFDQDDLTDLYAERTVEMDVTRTYSITCVVEESTDDEDAREKAIEMLRDGDLEHQFEDYNDEDFDITDVYE